MGRPSIAYVELNNANAYGNVNVQKIKIENGHFLESSSKPSYKMASF